MNFLPKEMKAVDIKKSGGPENLVLRTYPIPNIKENEILIKNKAIGVNRADCLQRNGSYPIPKDSNPMLGLEVSGEIVKLGKKVEGFNLGDKVCALTAGGGYAEYSSAPYLHSFGIPKDFNFTQAACIPEAAFTVYDNIYQRAKLKENERILIHGGSSGIGTFAIQLVKIFGSTIITTSGTKEKCDFCKNIGSDFSINYNKNNWVKEIENFTQGTGVNVILDIVAGDYIKKNISVLAQKGRHITIALQNGRFSEVDFGLIMRKQIVLSGSTLRPQSLDEKNKTADNLRKFVWPLLINKKIQPYIHSTFSLDEVQKAHQLMESGKHFGKIILLT